MRERSSTAGVARLMLLVAIFFSGAGPWLLAAIAGVIADSPGSSDAWVVAAPSPFYVFLMISELDSSRGEFVVAAGALCAVAWAMIGVGLLAAANSKCRAVIKRHEQILSEAEAVFAKEDAQANGE